MTSESNHRSIFKRPKLSNNQFDNDERIHIVKEIVSGVVKEIFFPDTPCNQFAPNYGREYTTTPDHGVHHIRGSTVSLTCDSSKDTQSAQGTNIAGRCLPNIVSIHGHVEEHLQDAELEGNHETNNHTINHERGEFGNDETCGSVTGQCVLGNVSNGMSLSL